MARGLRALPLSYSHHFGKGDWWDSNPRPRGPEPVLRTGSQSVFRVNKPQRSVVETMRLAANFARVMSSQSAVEAVSGHGRRGCGSDAICCRWIPNSQSVVSRRRWESNPLDAALQAAATPCDISVIKISVPARSRTWSTTFAESRASTTLQGPTVPHRGIEPRPTASKAVMRPPHPQGITQYPDLELNQGLNLRRVQCNPLHHREARMPTGR